MARIKSDIDSLFKQGLSNGKAPVSGSSMSDFERMMNRKSFFFFSPYNFNIYYLAAGLAVLGALAFLIFSNEEQEKSCIKPEIEQTIVKPSTNKSSDCTIAEPNSSDTKENQISENKNSPSTTKEEEKSCTKTTSPMDSMKKSMPIAQEKIEKPAVKENLISANVKQEIKREVKKNDTIYQIDTIRNQKTKVRLKWKK